MAIIKKGILGGVKGKVGVVSGRMYKYVNQIMSNSNYNQIKKSNKQNNQMSTMFHVRSYASAIYEDIIKHFYTKSHTKSTLFAEWIKENIPFYNKLGLEFPNNLVFSNGPLLNTPIDRINLLSGSNQLKITWRKNWGALSDNKNDLVSALFHNLVTGEVGYSIDTTIRSNMSVTINTFNTISSDTLNVWLFFRNQSKTIVSGNEYKLKS